MSEDNGRVTIGDAPGNSIPAEWAGKVLRELRKTDAGKQAVGQAIAIVAAREMAGVEISVKRRTVASELAG